MSQDFNINDDQTLLGIFSRIKKVFFGDGGDEMMGYDERISSAINSISTDILNKDAHNTAELMRGFISGTLEDQKTVDSIQFNPFDSFENMDRFNRYQNAEDIVNNIPYCRSALKVITNGIISPDNVTKEALQFLIDGDMTEEEKDKVGNLKQLSEDLEIEEMLFDIISETLKLGDQFIEICDYTTTSVPLSQSILSESVEHPDYEMIKQNITLEENEQHRLTFTEIYKTDDGLFEQVSKNYNVQFIIYEDEEKRELMKEDAVVTSHDVKDAAKKKKADVSHVKLIQHDPRFVVKLQSRRFKMNLGYLVLPANLQGAATNHMYAGGAKTGGSSSPQSMHMRSFGLGSNPVSSALTGVDKVYSNIIGIVRKYIGSAHADELDVDKKEMLSLVTRLVKELEADFTGQVKIRYVPPERMEHFTPGKAPLFFPYGEGIFQKSLFSAKLLMVMETAVATKRLSDASEKRIFYIEGGNNRTVRNYISEIKDVMSKRKYSLDSFGNIASIPSMVTSFEHFFVPKIRDRRTVEFDSLPPSVNLRDITEELKFYRDYLIAGLGVPPAYLSVDENISNKSTLAYENVLFAQDITLWQKNFAKHLYNLFSKVYRFVYGQNIPSAVNITFPAPRMLQLEREAEHIGYITNMINSLAELGLPKSILIKKYLSQDWDDLEKKSVEDALLQKGTVPPPPAPEEMGMGGPPQGF